MELNAAIDRHDSAGFNHAQGMSDRDEMRLQYHLNDVQDDILKDAKMLGRAIENFDLSDMLHFEDLMSRLFDADADSVGEAREDIGEFLRSKLGKEISAQADARLAAEVE